MIPVNYLRRRAKAAWSNQTPQARKRQNNAKAAWSGKLRSSRSLGSHKPAQEPLESLLGLRPGAAGAWCSSLNQYIEFYNVFCTFPIDKRLTAVYNTLIK
jgi:hypothetical protein